MTYLLDMMRTTLGELRTLVREAMNEGAGTDEPDDDPLMFEKDSVLVPPDVKRSIRSWMKQMGLIGHAKKPVRMR